MTHFENMAMSEQRAIDAEAEAQDDTEALREKAAIWLTRQANVFEVDGWFSDDQYHELARLDALICCELARPYSGAAMRDIEVGVREYSEAKREIMIDCAVLHASQFEYFNQEEI